MDLLKISNCELVERLEKSVGTERRLTHRILWYINEVESRKLYAELGFSSMYEYLTKQLGYGESSAYRRLQSARLLKQIPHLAEKIESGALNLTQLTQVQKCLKQEKKVNGEWDVEQTTQVLSLIENKSSLETQKVLAQEFNLPIQSHEIVRPQRDESYCLELPFTNEQMKTLEYAKSLLSHVIPDGSWAEVISFLAKSHIQKVEGKKEAVDVISTMRLSEMPSSIMTTQGFFSKQGRKVIKLSTRRKLMNGASKCCEYVDSKTQKRCASTYQLQVDHIVPLAKGGGNEPSNLRILCRTHNLLMAEKWGVGFRI